MPYRVGAKGSYGCSGYPVVKEGGEVMGCHKTRAAASAQIYAINQSEGNVGKSMDKAKKPNYEEMIEPRRGGSTPSNPKLYARVVQAAKDKFDVYPSAVANSWVVQEYKRRGGTYKTEKEITKSIWDNSLFKLGVKK
jgi:hypothetical protein